MDNFKKAKGGENTKQIHSPLNFVRLSSRYNLNHQLITTISFTLSIYVSNYFCANRAKTKVISIIHSQKCEFINEQILSPIAV